MCEHLRKRIVEEKLYICLQFRNKKNMPKLVVEYFDKVDQSNINESTCFTCEKCRGVMRSRKYN